MVPKTSAVLAKAARRQLRDLRLPPRRSSTLLFFILSGLVACFVILYYLIPRPPPFRTPPCGCPENEHQLSSVLLKDAKTAFIAEVARDRSLIPKAVLLGPPRLLSYPFDVEASEISACGDVKIGSIVLVLMGDIKQHNTRNATTSYSALSNCANVWISPWRLWMHAAPRLLSEEEHWWRSKPNALWNEATTFSSMPLHERRRVRNTSRAEWWLRDGVSVIAACMDRPDTLSVAATSWFTTGGIDEIVIVDWGSATPAIDELPDHYRNDPRLVYVRADLKAHQWVLSRAYNLALSFASRSTVLKVDCDTRLSDTFLTKHPLRHDRTFYAGDWRALNASRRTDGTTRTYRSGFRALTNSFASITPSYTTYNTRHLSASNFKATGRCCRRRTRSLRPWKSSGIASSSRNSASRHGNPTLCARFGTWRKCLRNQCLKTRITAIEMEIEIEITSDSRRSAEIWRAYTAEITTPGLLQATGE